MLTFSEVRRLFNYSPSTGILTWAIDKGIAKAGNEAGCRAISGHRKTVVNKTEYYVHRIIWLWYYGEWPSGVIDHDNGIRDDNRIDNLINSTTRQNCQNQKCHREGKLVGLTRISGSTKFAARLSFKGKLISLGSFNTEEEAHHAYLEACRRIENGEEVKSVKPNKGYSYNKKSGKYHSKYTFSKGRIWQGQFKSAELAIKARSEIERQVKQGVPLCDYVFGKIRYNPETESWTSIGIEFLTAVEAITYFNSACEG